MFLPYPLYRIPVARPSASTRLSGPAGSGPTVSPTVPPPTVSPYRIPVPTPLALLLIVSYRTLTVLPRLIIDRIPTTAPLPYSLPIILIVHYRIHPTVSPCYRTLPHPPPSHYRILLATVPLPYPLTTVSNRTPPTVYLLHAHQPQRVVQVLRDHARATPVYREPARLPDDVTEVATEI